VFERTIDDVARLNRRAFLCAAAGGATLTVLPCRVAAVVPTRARIVITGAGAAGLSMAARLVARFEGARITVVDARETHYFQPGFPLVYAGLWTADRVRVPNSSYMPAGVEWIRESVTAFDPDANVVTTSTGRRLAYDFLVVATGLTLDYSAIAGMTTDLVGKHSIGFFYLSPEAAAQTGRLVDDFVARGGVGLFGRPATEMKYAGAPLKAAFIAEDKLRLAGRSGRAEIVYHTPFQNLFAVAPVHEKVKALFEARSIKYQYSSNLIAIGPGRKFATYATPQGRVEMAYDFIHIIPPMRAPDAVRNSPLSWREGPLAADGWVEVDRATLRHRRYPNVFALGDVAGVPRGKTAASVKWQAPVAADNLAALIQGREPTAAYNSYTSCPMVTGYARAMLIEFDYEGQLTPSFWFISPLDELWVSWVIEGSRCVLPTSRCCAVTAEAGGARERIRSPYIRCDLRRTPRACRLAGCRRARPDHPRRRSNRSTTAVPRRPPLARPAAADGDWSCRRHHRSDCPASDDRRNDRARARRGFRGSRLVCNGRRGRGRCRRRGGDRVSPV